MKTKNLFVAVGTFIVAGLTSCDFQNDPENPNGGANYWEQNARVHHQLHGNVKSVQTATEYGDTSIVNFNEAGNISSITYEKGRMDTYTYNSIGQLTQVTFTDPAQPTETSTTYYTYGSHGKYVPLSEFHINEAGLAPNLVSIRYSAPNNMTTTYIFDKNTLYITSESEGIKDTTAIITYEGKYPVRKRMETIYQASYIWGEFIEISYQDNGMFKVYSEGFYGRGPNTYDNIRTTTYRTNTDFLLPQQYEMNDDGTITSNTAYTYNEKNDPINIVETSRSEVSTTTHSYEYDEQGNWTKRTTNRSSSNNVGIETRIISYY